jgi:hypothetical protein
VLATAQQRGQREDERKTDVVDASRRALDLIASDTRNAGFMVPRYAAVSSVDGGTGRADRLCVSDASYFDLPTPGSGTASSLDSRVTRFDGSVVTTLASNTAILDTLDIDMFGGVDYFVGRGITVVQHDGAPSTTVPAKGLVTWCARITLVDPQTRRIVIDSRHAIPGGLFALANVVAVPSHVYEIDDSNGLVLRRDGVALTDLVEDLQIEYWVDTRGVPDGVIDPTPGIEFPIHDLNTMPFPQRDTGRIRRVKISMLGRPQLPEEDLGVLNRPAVANRLAGPSDGFKRSFLSTSLLPTNLLDMQTYPNVP